MTSEQHLSSAEAMRLLEKSYDEHRHMYDKIGSNDLAIARLAGTLSKVEGEVNELKLDRLERRRDFWSMRASLITALVALSLWVATCWRDQNRIIYQPIPRLVPQQQSEAPR